MPPQNRIRIGSRIISPRAPASAPLTSTAPASSSSTAQAFSVAPVVATSSMIRTRRPATSPARATSNALTTLCRRSSAVALWACGVRVAGHGAAPPPPARPVCRDSSPPAATPGCSLGCACREPVSGTGTMTSACRPCSLIATDELRRQRLAQAALPAELESVHQRPHAAFVAVDRAQRVKARWVLRSRPCTWDHAAAASRRRSGGLRLAAASDGRSRTETSPCLSQSAQRGG